MTQIDIDNKMHKLNMKKRELKEQIKKQKEEQLTVNKKVKEKWYSERGDIHTNVLVIGAYLQVLGQLKNKLKEGKIDKREMYEEIMKFIKSLYLNKKSIDEIVNLCSQLQAIMIDLNPNTKIDIYSISPPNAKEQTLLQQLILVGFPENIAKKKEVLNGLGVDINLQRKRPEYECLFSHQTVYLHASSNLKNPKFVCYKEIQQVNVKPKNEDDTETTRNYLRGCTMIDTPLWIYNLGSQNLINTCEYLKMLKTIYDKAKEGKKVDFKEVKGTLKKMKQ